MAQGQEWPEFQPSRRKANNANCHIVLTAKENTPPLHLFSKTTQEMCNRADVVVFVANLQTTLRLPDK